MHFEEIIIGSSLEALLLAFEGGIPIFFDIPNMPHRFEYFDTAVDLSWLGIQDSQIRLKTPTGEIAKGQQKLILWERLNFILNLAGLSPLNGSANSLRIESENVLKAYNEFSKIATVSFDRAYFFAKEKKTKTKIFDWIAVHSGGKHDFDLIETGDDFVKEIWFYESDRVHSGIKDICAISHIDDSLLSHFDYSDTYARFKVEKVMKSHGFRGASNGIDKLTGKQKHYAVKTSSIKRETTHTRNLDVRESEYIKLMTNNSSDHASLNEFSIGSSDDSINNILRKMCI